MTSPTPPAEQPATTTKAATPKGDATTGAAPVVQPGAVYAELPQPDSWFHFTPQYWENNLRDFADRTHALRMQAVRCSYCDGTGDVHSIDGEWRGICTECEAGTALRQAAPKAAPAVDDDLWYLQDTRSYVGNDVLWWAKDGNGYTTDVSKAHVYNREAAFRQAAMRGTDRAWPKAYIDSKTRPAVDMQYVSHDAALAAQGGA